MKKYEQQFQIAYDQRELFIYPLNECNIEKFICTTVKPSMVGIVDFNDHLKCSRYLSNYIRYEPLEFADKYPQYTPSPTNVLRWQKADCFDFSIVLCSFLIGFGYDAYCVIGTASKDITLRNESVMENPFMVEELTTKGKKKRGDSGESNNFYFRPMEVVKSKYLEDTEEREIEAKVIQEPDDDEPKANTTKNDFKKRIHCWVLIRRGQKNIPENIFIEPSIGHPFTIDQTAPYFSVDAIFNDKNYWINLK